MTSTVTATNNANDENEYCPEVAKSDNIALNRTDHDNKDNGNNHKEEEAQSQ